MTNLLQCVILERKKVGDTDMKYCPNCRNLYPDHLNFCLHCGLPLQYVPPQQPVMMPQKADNLCVTALVLGICSIAATWMGIGIFVAIPGLVISLCAKKRDAVCLFPRSQNATFASVGLWCSIAGLVISFLMLLFAIVVSILFVLFFAQIALIP